MLDVCWCHQFALFSSFLRTHKYYILDIPVPEPQTLFYIRSNEECRREANVEERLTQCEPADLEYIIDTGRG